MQIGKAQGVCSYTISIPDHIKIGSHEEWYAWNLRRDEVISRGLVRNAPDTGEANVGLHTQNGQNHGQSDQKNPNHQDMKHTFQCTNKIETVKISIAMLFNSLNFVPFLIFSLLAFYLLPRLCKRYVVLVLSYVFYSFWDWRFCFLLLLSTAVDYFLALRIHECSDKVWKGRYLKVSLFLNLGFLGVFKYFNFFIENFARLMTEIGLETHPVALQILLPVGISFYTLHNLSYIIDVWKGEVRATRDFVGFANYVAFFPQLVAGPIARAQSLLPQVMDFKKPTALMIEQGFILVAFGYFKKVVVGDNIGEIADHAFESHAALDAFTLWQGALAFSLQLYFDFSGYSDIARGIAKWFGVELMLNFRQPHFAANITDFWRRWHISLSSWIRDYLYISLGGSRRGTFRNYFNIFISMVIVGVWHGANWTFVAFGVWHGALLCLHKAFQDFFPGILRRVSLGLSIALTQLCVILSEIFFRSRDISSAFIYIARMVSSPWVVTAEGFFFITFLVSMVILIDGPIAFFNDEYYLLRLPPVARIMIYTLVIAAAIILMSQAQERPRSFIYFQF